MVKVVFYLLNCALLTFNNFCMEFPNMETQEIKNDGFRHYHKINIFGEPGVGKTNLISLFEHFDDNNFKIKKGDDNNNSFNEQSFIVEQIKKIGIKLNDNRTLYLNIYKTNIDKYDTVRMNLDTLLFQTECIIIMFNSHKDTFLGNLPNLVSTIKDIFKNKKVPPIFLIENKINLNKEEVEEEKEEEFKSELEKILNDKDNIKYYNFSLLNDENNTFTDLLLEIDRKIIDQNDNNNDNTDPIKLKYLFKIYKDISNCQHKISILLLGDSSTGKTTFLNKLLMEEDNDNSNVKNNNKKIKANGHQMLAYINNKIFKIQILDPTKEEKEPENLISCFNPHGFLLFFDVTNEESFNSLDKWIKNIKERSKNYDENNNSIILIANKIDKSDDRKIAKNNVKNYAEQNKLKYFECSSNYDLNVLEIFNEIISMSYYIYKEVGNNDGNGEKNNNKGGGKTQENCCIKTLCKTIYPCHWWHCCCC